MMESDPSPPGSQAARDALDSIGAARRRRRAVIIAPQWLHWGLALCLVFEGLAYGLGGWRRTVVQTLVLVAIFALSFAAQRNSGMVTRLTRPPSRPLGVWVAFVAIVATAVWLTDAAARRGHGPLACFALAGVMVIFGPRLQALWRRSG